MTFDVPEGFVSTQSFTNGVVTVSSANAQTVRDMLSISKPAIGSFKMTVDIITKGDETTVMAIFKEVGTVMVFR